MPTTPWRRRMTGAAMVAIPASAAALTAGQALAANATPDSVPARVRAHHIDFGESLRVSGALPAADAGHKLELEFRAAGRSGWQPLASTTSHPDGHYRLSARLRQSGAVRVVDTSGTGSSASDVASGGQPQAHAALAPSGPQHVTVAAKLDVGAGNLSAVGGQALAVRGRMLPRLPGRVIRLQGGTGHGWRTLAATRTGSGGRFTLRFRPSGSQALRVSFGGDLESGKATAPAGSVTRYSASTASWYSDGGATACGFHAYYGVANRSLPCGTHVKIRYGSRSVTAVVDDRGPYVGGRDWDLNQNTAAALGFGGVGTVWVAF